MGAGRDDLRRQLRDPAQHHRRARARPPTGTLSTGTVEALKARAGQFGPPREHIVEAGHLRRFAAAIGDPNPRWQTEAPPTFLVALAGETPQLPEALAHGKGWLNGGDRFEYELPIRAGDRLTVRTRLADVYEKRGSSGDLLFLVWEHEYRNSEGDVVARLRGTRIRR